MNYIDHPAFGKFDFNPPESMESIRAFEAQAAVKLPQTYVDFLLQSSGGVGFIGPDNHMILWKLTELIELNLAYEANKYAPGFLLIGSTGGGEAIAIDNRASTHAGTSTQPIVQIPFIGMEPSAAQALAADFAGFMTMLASEEMYG